MIGLFGMAESVNVTRWLGMGSVTAAIGSAIGFLTPDAIVPAITAGIAICTAVIYFLRTPGEVEHKRQLRIRDEWNAQIEDIAEENMVLFHAWKAAAMAGGANTVDEDKLIAQLRERRSAKEARQNQGRGPDAA